MDENMKFNSEKFKQIVLYIINCKYGSQLGNTRLHKILWFSDLENYRNTYKTITCETYLRRDYGPISKHLFYTLENLRDNGFISIDRVDDESMWLYYPLRKADISFLTEAEKNIIDSKINELSGLSASDLNKITHTPLWESLKDGDVMGVSLAYIETLRENIDDNSICWGRVDV